MAEPCDEREQEKKPFVKNKQQYNCGQCVIHTHTDANIHELSNVSSFEDFLHFYVFSLVLYAIIRQSQTVSSGETCATSLTDTTSEKRATNHYPKKKVAIEIQIVAFFEIRSICVLCAVF